MRIGFASVGDKFQAMESRTDAKPERLEAEMLRPRYGIRSAAGAPNG
jgi:hypothetical protein